MVTTPALTTIAVESRGAVPDCLGRSVRDGHNPEMNELKALKETFRLSCCKISLSRPRRHRLHSTLAAPHLWPSAAIESLCPVCDRPRPVDRHAVPLVT